MIIGADECFGIVPSGAQEDAVLPDNFAAAQFRDVLKILDHKRGQDMARQEAAEIEAEGECAIGLEIMVRLLRREKRRNDDFGRVKFFRFKTVGDAERRSSRWR